MAAKVLIVDRKDNPIGALDRQEAIDKGQIRRIVKILLVNGDKILLQKRSKNVNSPGLWDTSAGGHVDEGEDYLFAAQRELEEELGIVVDQTNFLTLGKEYTEFVNSEGKDSRAFMTTFVVKHVVEIENIVFNRDEVEDIDFFLLDEISELIQNKPHQVMKGTIAAFDKYSKKLKKFLAA